MRMCLLTMDNRAPAGGITRRGNDDLKCSRREYGRDDPAPTMG